MNQRETELAEMSETIRRSAIATQFHVLSRLHQALNSRVQALAMFRTPTEFRTRSTDVAISIDRLLTTYRLLSPYGPYNRLNLIGRGGCGEVFMGKYCYTGARVALKFVEQEMNKAQIVINEAYILARLQHPCIVRLIDADSDDRYPDKVRVCFVQELIEGKDGSDFMDEMQSPFSEVAAQEVYRQFLSAVHYMHTEGYAHRDLKCANMMVSSLHPDAPKCYSKGYMFKSVDHLTDALDSLHVKLIDVGFAAKMDTEGNVPDNICGTLSYIAPELFQKAILKDKFPFKLNGQSIDMWACGIVLYDFLTWGKNPLPFDELKVQGMKDAQVIVEILKFTPQNRHNIPELAWDLVISLLQPSPEKRFNVSRILQHPWMTHKFLPVQQQQDTFPLNTSPALNSAATMYRPVAYGDKGMKPEVKIAGLTMSLSQIMASALIPDVVKSSLRFDDRDLIGKLSVVEEMKLVRLGVLAMIENSDDTAREIGYALFVEKNRHVKAAVLYAAKHFIESNGIKVNGHAKIFIEQLQNLKSAISDEYFRSEEEFRRMKANGDSFEFFPENIPTDLIGTIVSPVVAPVVAAGPALRLLNSEVGKKVSKLAELSKCLDSPKNAKPSEVDDQVKVKLPSPERVSLSSLCASLVDSDDEEDVTVVVCPPPPKPAAVCLDRVEPLPFSRSQHADGLHVVSSGSTAKRPIVVAPVLARAAPALVRPSVVAPTARVVQKSPATAFAGRVAPAPLRQVQVGGRFSGKAVAPAVDHKKMITPKPDLMKKPLTTSAKQSGEEKVQRKAAVPAMQKRVGTPSTRPTTASPPTKQVVVAVEAPAIRRPIVEHPVVKQAPVKQASRVVPSPEARQSCSQSSSQSSSRLRLIRSLIVSSPLLTPGLLSPQCGLCFKLR